MLDRMISLFILYLIIIVIYSIWIYFGQSLHYVQKFHHKLTDYDYGGDLTWTEDFSETVSLKLLAYCVFSSVHSNYSLDNKFHIIRGLTFTRNVQDIGILTVFDTFAVIALTSTSCISDVIFSSLNSLIDVDETDHHDSGKIHEGYYIHSKEFVQNILTLLDSTCITNIYVTGHSMGGSLASIVGYLLSKTPSRNFTAVVYTFGSPKFGDAQLKETITSKRLKIYNTVNVSDLVVTKPSNCSYVVIGDVIEHKIDTGNNNVNHGIKVYREIVQKRDTVFPKRGHRFDEIVSRWVLDMLG